ncbi:hypothetical protein SBRCBS47491_008211 [Sporothrix bragantina]|uniref:DUF1754-domain-containing protein n=1 Tax=Sporothrix bragantina TaxID=671064 RepID=A0ABP0CJK8_9PEZI
MPSDEYASASGGALRLKGAKVEKHKSKKHKKRSRDKERDREDREDRARRAGDELARRDGGDSDKKEKKHRKSRDDEGSNEEEEDGLEDIKNDPYARMTPAERRFAEAQDKKIRDLMHASPEEARAARPELFKSHKERLADLNTYLSRLSEHNDMPKIGPG